MTHIDYYLATMSPYCYLAGDRLEQIADKHGAQITYKPVSGPDLFPRMGAPRPEDRHPSRMEYRGQELARWAAYLDMPMNMKPAFFPTNLAPSSYAIIAAQEEGGDVGSLVHAFTRACWAEERNIAEDAVIRDVLEQAGLDPEIANRGLLTGAEIYGRNLEQAVEAGVFGVPFYVVRETGQRFWGQDRLDFLDRHLATI